MTVHIYTYPKTSWQGFINFLKEKLDRELTKVETEAAMKAYIVGTTVEKYLEEMK